MLESRRREAKERARTEAKQKKESIKAELGAALMDVIEEHFPEQRDSTRGRSRWSFLILGFLAGVFLTRRLYR